MSPTMKFTGVIPAIVLLLTACSGPANTSSSDPTRAVVSTAGPQASAATIPVPDVVGKTGDVAKDAIQEAGLSLKWDAGNDTVILSGNWTVTDELPKAGTKLPSDAEVTLKVVKTSTLAPSAPTTGSGGPKNSDPTVTKQGLTVGGAIVACDRVGDKVYPFGFKDHFILGALEQKIVNDKWVIRSQVTITNAFNAKRDAVMSCHVGGRNEDPSVTSFKVLG